MVWQYIMVHQPTSYRLWCIHLNPCSGKWKLAVCPEDYPHSSAKFYSTGIQGLFHVSHIMQLMDVDLSKNNEE